MNKRDWLIWFFSVLFIIFASTFPLKIYWKTLGGTMCLDGTLFELMRFFITRFLR